MNKIKIYGNLSELNSIHLIKVLMGVALIFLSSQIVIPLSPVPVTLQTMAIIYIGLTYESKIAKQTILSYLGLGIIGAPVFLNLNGGLSYFMGPTAGYLVGFYIAILAMSFLKTKFKPDNFFKTTLVSLAGLACIFSLGITWLSLLFGIEKAFQVGLMPFIIPGIAKIMILSTMLNLTKK